MRAYKTSDVFVVVNMLRSIYKAGVANDGFCLYNILTAKESGEGEQERSDEERFAQIGEIVMRILDTCYTSCEDKLTDWLASLNDQSREEFLNAPADNVLDMIEEIAFGDESKSFFSRVSVLYNRIKGSETTTKSA